jgi:hypothetical protein
MTTPAQAALSSTPAPQATPGPQRELAEHSMLGGTRIMSSAVDAERSARLITWLCALIGGRDPRLL